MRSSTPVFLIAVTGLAACATEVPTARLVIEGVNVIDVRDGSVAEDMALIVDGDRIRAIGRSGRISVPDGTPVVDGTGKFAIPGLWDMHAHTLWPGSPVEVLPRLFVAHGVTGFRDMSGNLEVAEQLRGERASGDRIAPRFLVAGHIVDGPNPVDPGALVAATPEHGRTVVDSLVTAGAEFIKVYSLLPAETFHAIADQAKRRGIRFAGHVPAYVRAADAAEAGQRTIEHLTEVAKGCSSAEEEIISDFVAWRAANAGDSSIGRLHWQRRSDPRILSTQDAARCDRLMQTFVRHETWQVPTLVALRGYAFRSDAEFTNDPRLRYLPSFAKDIWAEESPAVREMTEDDWQRERRMLALSFRLTGQASDAGVPILAGSDTPGPYAFPGSSLHDELELLVEAGLSPLEALQAATLSPARFLEATDSLGTLEVDRLADIVLLDANPLEDIGNVRTIHAVLLGGELLTRENLDALLAEAETLASQWTLGPEPD